MADIRLPIGTKVYNVFYGPMTVVGIYECDKTPILCCSVDDTNGLSPKYLDYYLSSPKQNYDKPDWNNRLYIKWLPEALDTLIFLKPNDVKTNNIEGAHSFFTGSVVSESPVGIKKTSSDESPVGVIKNGENSYPGESPVGIKH